MSLIAITGTAGSGKDTVAKMIQYYFSLKEGIMMVNLDVFLREKVPTNHPYSWQIKKFAAKLKQICAILVGCNESDFESEEFKNTLLPKEWQYDYNIKCDNGNLTYRWLLQQVGTEVMRNNINNVTWINGLFADYKPYCTQGEIDLSDDETPVFPNWIISDLRFKNEALAIKQKQGIIIKIFREESKSNHSSETELKQIKADYEIDNCGTIEELYNNVKVIFEKL